ncbi:MAG: cellulase family glycosylhydrolase [Chloroflexia bacterium]|nr:cellulase family glycosylhydrolase [Chloroflexia bacterium]
MSTQPAHQHVPYRNRKERQWRTASGLKSTISVLNVALIATLVFSSWSVFQLQPWNDVATRDAAANSVTQWSDVNPYGVNTFLSGEVESWKRDRTMAMVAEAGIGWIRQGFAWSEIEPENDVYWDAKYQQDAWAKFDEIVALAERYGVRIIARLDHTPDWARPPGSDPGTPPTDPNDFGDFVHAFVSRYQGRVNFIQVWNEPNLAREWGGVIDPAGYATLLATAAERAREANPNIVILSAPMAMTTENSGRAQDELGYWQALYDHGVSESFDIMSANAYGLADHYAAEPSASVLNVRRVELLRELAVRNGDGHKSIWFNEFGWNAAPAEFPLEQLTWSRVDEELQAEWTAGGVEYAQQTWDWFGMASIWYFRQVGNIAPDRADYYFRMVDLEFTPRDVYRSVQASSSRMQVAGVGHFGELETPISPYGRWAIIKNTGASNGRYMLGESGSSVAVRFTGSALDLRLVDSGSNGTFSVTIFDGATMDGEGSQPRVFSIEPGQDSVRVTSTALPHPASAAPQTRTALITVDDGSQLAIDGVSVYYEPSYRNLLAGTAVAAATLVALIWLRRQLAR